MELCMVHNKTEGTQEYLTAKELAGRLSISEKTIHNNTFKIEGRCKIGGSVRYHWPTIERHLHSGKNLYRKEI